MLFWVHLESDSSGEDWEDALSEDDDPSLVFIGEHVVDQELLEYCATHIGYIRERVELTGGVLFVEQSVPVDHITEEDGATGSVDVGIVYGDTCEIVDLKLGRGVVSAYQVVTPEGVDIITGDRTPEEIEPYEQLAMYGSGLMRKLELLYEFKHVVLVISQPPLRRITQWSGTVSELNKVIDRLRVRAVECDEAPVFRPSASNCHFCRASGNCEAQTRMVIETALDGFEDVDNAKPKEPAENALGSLYAVIPLVQDWCKAVEARVRDALKEGRPVVRNDGFGYKLVEGKNTARQWKDAAEAEAALKKMRLKADQMYETSLISPTTAEKLSKSPRAKKGEPPLPPVLGPTQWDRLQGLIVQGKGQPVIALETDPRPAVAPATEGFDDVPPADNSDLF